MPSPHHLLQSLRLYRITSSVMYFTSELVCTLWSRACQILSEFSEAMNAAYVLCMAFRFSWTICMIVLLIVQVEYLIEWLVIWDWYQELVGMVRSQQHSEGFFCIQCQVRARSEEVFVSAIILSIMWVRVWLFLPTTSLLHGDSTSVVCTVIPRWFAISRNSLLANSTPLSVRNFWRVL